MKNKYLHEVNMAGFMLDEAVLYLDTHPCDQEAMDYYRMAKEKYEEAVAAYNDQVGPLFYSDVICSDMFAWIEEPWPWEGGCA